MAPENSLNAGEVSRDLVADVAVAAVFDAKAKNKVVEIVESDKRREREEWRLQRAQDVSL